MQMSGAFKSSCFLDDPVYLVILNNIKPPLGGITWQVYTLSLIKLQSHETGEIGFSFSLRRHPHVYSS